MLDNKLKEKVDILENDISKLIETFINDVGNSSIKKLILISEPEMDGWIISYSIKINEYIPK